ncbi:hypothetical protein JCM6882_005340 [Rhodosporidiobolus microsporus]
MAAKYDADTIFGLAAAAFISLGGVLGLLRRGSWISFIMAGGSGLLLSHGVQRQRVDPKDVGIIVGVAGFLFVVMGLRFLRGRKIMPAGLVTAISAGLLWRFGQRLL